MSDNSRISVKVTEDFRRKLHAALSLKGTNATKWVRYMGQKEIASMEESMKEPLVKNNLLQ